jgi:integrase/recombinase XerD
MPRGYKIMLSFADWPAADRGRWEAAFKIADRFDESSYGAHLAPATRKARRESYGRFLGFISAIHPNRLTAPPEARIDRSIVAEYADWRRRSGEVASLAADLGHLHDALKLICPNTDWSWLLAIIKRMAATAPRSAGKYHLVTSDRLYLLGIELMDRAVADADDAQRTDKVHAFQYRDGLIIALLALIPLRSRTLTALRMDQHLVRTGDLWALDIPAADTKTRRALDFAVSREMSARIDLYLEQFRSCIPGADKHTGLWPSNKSRPMCANGIYLTVRKRTKEALGFGVNLHRFRHAAASFWSTRDPVNVRGVKDVLGQASFGTTEKHYIMAQSRLAGRALAQAIDAVRK